ncbi:hypothetical protein INS49_002738 [Diaporthe citri]|uniref:uncharacterized protein n=1 Tax=Diaporthe citri TaxID=83186 RepID=UPI001C7E306E|nr:uncharacterized protein INS49_002738 [Diaporthe citri]KAG6368528.1 hypothetical protein INS49_002738 [Diaporthe citri]
MKVFQCDFDLVAYAYSNWTFINGTINAEALAWSPLNFTTTEALPLVVFNATSHEFPESENRTFSVSIYDLKSMYSVLASIFQRRSDNQVFSQSMYQNALYNSANLTETAENIAMAMSFRMLQGPNATLVHGSVYEMQTYIHVHWWWLALNVALLLLASALLGTTIALSREANLGAWKSSLDPLLYGVDLVGSVPLSAENPGVSLDEDSQSPKKKTIIQQSRWSDSAKLALIIEILENLHIFQVARSSSFQRFHLPYAAASLAARENLSESASELTIRLNGSVVSQSNNSKRNLLPKFQPALCNSGDGAIGTYWQTAPSTAPFGTAEYYGNLNILVHKAICSAQLFYPSESGSQLPLGREGNSQPRMDKRIYDTKKMRRPRPRVIGIGKRRLPSTASFPGTSDLMATDSDIKVRRSPDPAAEPVDDSLCLHRIMKKREAERKARADEEGAAAGVGIDKATPGSPDALAEG